MKNTCPTCRGTGNAWVCLVEAQHGRYTTTYLPARCPCGAGQHGPRVPELRDRLDWARSPEALSRYPGLVDVVEVDRPWGDTYARALAQVLGDGERVQAHHRTHAWRAVEAARRPVSDLEAFPRLEVPPVPREGPSRPTRRDWDMDFEDERGAA